MRTTFLLISRFAFVPALAALAAASQAFTMASFADPAVGPATPLFTWNSSAISGGWSAPGLQLLTPGWAGPDIANAKFNMPAVTLTPIGGGFFAAGPGAVHFTDASNSPVLNITFSSGFLSIFGFGGNDFVGNNVVFSGPGVPSGMIQNSFSFAFANLASNPDHTTATASFTSSAVPEPGSMLALGLGAACLLARLRRSRA